MMVRFRAAAGLLAAGLVIAASVLGATPASAATLPTGSLPATGSTVLDFIPIAIGAVLLLLAGIALAVTRRISNRRRIHHP